MNEQETPKKISPDQVEIIGTHGEVVKEAARRERVSASPFGFGQVKVFKGGPWMLLLLPVIIPILFFALFFIGIFALVFGRGFFKIVGRNVPRN